MSPRLKTSLLRRHRRLQSIAMVRIRRLCGLTFMMAFMLAIASPPCFSLDTEIEKGIGRWMAQAFIAQRGRLDQPPIADWVRDLGEELAAHTPRQNLRYHFVVLDSPEVNGFALPGGWVFVTAGLLETMNSEDELAAVLSHELAHLANRDFQQVVMRNAIYLGIAHLLRGSDTGDWIPVVHAVQLVDGLRDSRRREARADHVGSTIAWRAGYDPRAMASFLGTGTNWSYLQEIFATHPHPSKRVQWIEERFEHLRRDDPGGLADLAESMIERGRYAAASRLLEKPLPEAWEDRRESLLLRAEAARIPLVAPADASGLPAETAAALQESLSALTEGRQDAEEKEALAWRRVRRTFDDEQIRRGMVYAQAIDPQLSDPGYLALLAQTVHLMHRASRGANLTARILRTGSTNANTVHSLGESLTGARADPREMPLLQATAVEVEGLARELGERSLAETGLLARMAGEYHESGRIVALLLGELALYGEGYPLGRLVFSRFMIIQTQVRMLGLKLDRLDAETESIAAARWRDAILARRLQLNVVGLQVGSAGRQALLDTLARRIGVTAEELQAAAEEPAGLGDAALQLLHEHVTPDDARFGSDLRAMQIIMRISLNETQEQVYRGKR